MRVARAHSRKAAGSLLVWKSTRAKGSRSNSTPTKIAAKICRSLVAPTRGLGDIGARAGRLSGRRGPENLHLPIGVIFDGCHENIAMPLHPRVNSSGHRIV